LELAFFQSVTRTAQNAASLSVPFLLGRPIIGCFRIVLGLRGSPPASNCAADTGCFYLSPSLRFGRFHPTSRNISIRTRDRSSVDTLVQQNFAANDWNYMAYRKVRATALIESHKLLGINERRQSVIRRTLSMKPGHQGSQVVSSLEKFKLERGKASHFDRPFTQVIGVVSGMCWSTLRFAPNRYS